MVGLVIELGSGIGFELGSGIGLSSNLGLGFPSLAITPYPWSNKKKCYG